MKYCRKPRASQRNQASSGRVRDIEALDELLATLTDDKPRVIALQPISQKEDATRLCIDTCIARNWRLSMQTHKYLNIA